MLEFVRVTALYSNAVLTAILPHVSDFAQRAELRTNPITAGEVKIFYCDPRRGQTGGHLYLTNGWGFWFADGHTFAFETRKCYFHLQNPDRIPEYYGPINMSVDEALALGRRIISQLKGTAIEDILARRPRITMPIRLADGVVPRYRIQWPSLKAGTNWAGGIDTEIDLEINASNKKIEMLSLIASTNFYQSAPAVEVIPEPLTNTPSLVPRDQPPPLPPVSRTYSNAFLQAILPAFNDYAKRLELPVPLPITASMIREGPYTGIHQNGGLPHAQIELTNGCMFRFQHGYVTTFAFLYDTFYSLVRTNKYEDLIGPIRMTEAEVYKLARETIQKLGYSEKDIPILARRPWGWIGPPAQTNGFTRVNVVWLEKNKQNDPDPAPIIQMEVDTNARRVKSICIREPRLWRDPPKIDVPMAP